MSTHRIALTLFAVSSLLAADRYTEDFHESHPFQAGGKLTLEGFNGSVEITGWDQSTIDISGTKYAKEKDLLKDIKLSISVAGGVATLKAERPDRNNWRGELGVKWVIKTPRRTELEKISSSNGSVQVQDIDASAKVNTSNGAIRVSRVKGTLNANTSNGRVEVSELGGGADVHTSNGGIRADLTNAGGSPVKFTTSNGPVDVKVSNARTAGVTATTSNGAITVRMPQGVNADVKASTSNGRVSSEFDVLVAGGGRIEKHALLGKIGSGGAPIELRTSNGAIKLAKI